MEQKVSLIRSEKAAEFAVDKQATRLSNKKTIEELRTGITEFGTKIRSSGAKLLRLYADRGVWLEALKRKAPHGTFMEEYEALGLDKSTVSRSRELAVYREMLPPKQHGDVEWTIAAALEFGREKQNQLTDMSCDTDGITDADLNAQVERRLSTRRRGNQARQLAAKVLKLEVEVMQAMQDGDLGAGQATDAWLSAAKRLKNAQADLRDDNQEES